MNTDSLYITGIVSSSIATVQKNPRNNYYSEHYPAIARVDSFSCSVYIYYALGEVKSLVFSGKAPVDSLCDIKDNTHVFTEGDDIWDVMLNQVSLKLHSFCTCKIY